MKLWLGMALLSCGAAVAASLWLAPQSAALPTVVAPLSTPPAVAPLASKPAPLAPALKPRSPLPVAAPSVEVAAYSVAEAQMLMQVMAEQGDPRQPVAGGLQPRPTATPAQLASPEQYAAFEDQQTRAQVQAWAGGVQQIPYMREQIELAAQSGERTPVEINEARAALEQLEMMQSQLQREAPALLPSGAPVSGPAAKP